MKVMKQVIRKQRSLHVWSILTGALTLSTVLLLVGCDSSPSSDDPPPNSSAGAQVTVAENETMGRYLTDEDGRSLYLFTDGNGNPVPCTSDACVGAWPLFLTEGEPGANGGADAALLGTTERSDGDTQVVYNGWPLYYFAGDESPGDVNGQGIESFGGKWFLVSPSGEKVEADDGGSDDDDDDGDDGDDDPRY